MLSRLSIKNYAIIESLEVAFQPGLNIITGETGAGKSILMGALGLVLGDRADSAVLFSAADKCVVEAAFVPADAAALRALLAAHELDEDEQLLVRREIAANGKSRSFINDTPVTLQVLRRFTASLVDLHRQFDTLELGEDEFQRGVLDALAGNAELLHTYSSIYQAWHSSQQQLQALQQLKAQAGKELDYHRFLHDELAEANLQPDEIENAETEYEWQANAGQVKQTLSGAAEQLLSGESPVVPQLKAVLQQLQQLKSKPPELEPQLERLQAAYVEVKDIADELEALADKTSMDEERLMLLQERINLGNKLLKKHGLQTTAQLLALQHELSEKLQQVLQADDDIAALEKQVAQHLSRLQQTGQQLSKRRQAVVKNFETEVLALLQQVGMPNARLKVQLSALATPAPHGTDEVQMLFDANKSNRFEPIGKVASGGELSRLMLSIKSLVASSMQMPTLIFDEIDTGISGEAARQVGIIMKGMADKHQLLTITHQPQIAARAHAHFFVYKQEEKGKVRTGIRLLDQEQRVEAVAHMLSGNQQTEASRNIAREMMAAM
jgi:DNA repair protein RecN (Recombination protein N)